MIKNDHTICLAGAIVPGGGGGGTFGHFHTVTYRLSAQTQPCLKYFGTQKYYPVKNISMKHTPCIKNALLAHFGRHSY